MNRRSAIKSIVAGGIATLGPWKASHFAADKQTPQTAVARKRTVRFAHFTDTHVYAKRNATKGLAAAIRHVHALPDRPDFVLNGGDAIYDALEVTREAADAQWTLWKEAWKQNGTLPLRHCLGNHDIWGWNKAGSKTTGSEAGWGKQLALDHLGLERPYYSFDAGGWRIFVLDSMTFDEQTAYQARFDDAQLQWLTSELKATPATTPIVVVSHIPILTVGTVGFTPELRKHPEADKMLSHRDGFELVNLLSAQPNVKLCLSGHTHLTEKVTFGSLDFVNSGAVSGLWWKGNFAHTDEGYNLVDLYDDGSYATTYTSYGWDAKV